MKKPRAKIGRRPPTARTAGPLGEPGAPPDRVYTMEFNDQPFRIADIRGEYGFYVGDVLQALGVDPKGWLGPMDCIMPLDNLVDVTFDEKGKCLNPLGEWLRTSIISSEWRIAAAGADYLLYAIEAERDAGGNIVRLRQEAMITQEGLAVLAAKENGRPPPRSIN